MALILRLRQGIDTAAAPWHKYSDCAMALILRLHCGIDTAAALWHKYSDCAMALILQLHCGMLACHRGFVLLCSEPYRGFRCTKMAWTERRNET